MERITIIGLGLIGGSLGLALKAANLREIEIVGFDKDSSVISKAQKKGAIDRGERSLERAVRDTALVLLATPVLSMRRLLSEIAPYLREGAIVTDTGSTKAVIHQWASEFLPEDVSFIGGHPMAGKETAGIDAAEATLFKGKAYCVSPAVGASEGAVKAVLGIITTIGARPVFMDPEEHDSYVAAISHLPIILATSLFRTARSSLAWPELANLASSGFRDTTRLASSEPELSHDICITNRENVIHWIDRFIADLSQLRDLIRGKEDEELYKTFAKTQMDRDAFLAGQEVGRDMRQAIELPSTGESLLSILVGERWVRRAFEVAESLEKRAEERERERRLRREDW